MYGKFHRQLPKRKTEVRTEVSILIPTFNDDCYELVAELVRQASEITPLKFEILVGDDGSTDETVIKRNRQAATLGNCRYVRQDENAGRAAIRNFLARQARHEWLLFIDSDMGIASDNFLKTYLTTENTPVYGGYVVAGQPEILRDNLRYLYETTSAPRHTPKQRQKHPNHDFHTSNFFVGRNLFLQHPLDKRFRRYGYEDIFWGKQLSDAGITIHHIDNPVVFSRFETNGQFMDKTEEGLLTLLNFRKELDGYSRLLKAREIIDRLHLKGLCEKIFRRKRDEWRASLCHRSPSLRLFRIYKLLYTLSN